MDLKDFILRNGGGTFSSADLLPVSPTSGFGVGLINGTAVKLVAADVSSTDITGTLRRVGQTYNSRFVGAWVDAEGTIHIDPSDIIKDLDEAIALGKANDQESIWDFANGEAIYL